MNKPQPTRRDFIKSSALASAGLFLPVGFLGEFGQRFVSRRLASQPVRVRGRVAAASKGLARVAVSDGATVVQTRADGSYELLTDAARPWVFVSVPAGYDIPRNATGTARFYQPLQPNAKAEVTVDFTLSPSRESDENHRFLVLADPQMQNAYETGLFQTQTTPDVQALLKAAPALPTFGIGCGDLLFDDLTLYPDYHKGVRAMDVPFFQVIGNHDLDLKARTDEQSSRTFQQTFGPAYYSFNRGAVHYVVLDDVFFLGQGAGYIGYLPEAQLTWLENDLATVERGKTVVVALHIPPLATQYARRNEKTVPLGNSVSNRDELYRLLEPYKATLLCGHTHESEHTFAGNRHEHVTGAVCGAWWSGPICYDGTPNGYAVYTAKGESLSWQYKSTGLPIDQQLRAYRAGSDPAFANEIVANVWDWDENWQVVWYEDGQRRGTMTQRTGLDPLSVQLHTGPTLPARRPWVDPVPTRHLFYAAASPNAKQIRVEATDRLGRTYSAVV